VVPLAASSRFAEPPGSAAMQEVPARYGVKPGHYVLAIGTLEPRKNLLRLIHAHAALPDALRRGHPLLIVGPRGWEEGDALAEAGSREDVRLAGFVAEADLPALYSGCAVFCYPSLYEGFGLPVLEAMAAGAAVITSDVSSLPEVGGDAVAYVSPEDEHAITGALDRLLGAPGERAELGERARRRAADFSWERVAREMLDQLELAAGARSTRS
jgi:alpha-1,3-rhamnosyl/mannosyltransferase